MYVFDDESITIKIPFMLDGDFVTPDVGSVKYTIRDNSGTPIIGQIDVPVTTTTETTSVVLDIAGFVNAKAKEVENRFVTLKYKVSGAERRIQVNYQIIDWINLTASPSQVRNALGVDGDELEDDDINLLAAYMRLKQDLGGTILVTALMAGDLTTIYANHAVALRTALDLISSLQLRVTQQERSDTSEFQRFAKVDFNKIRADIQANLDVALLGVEGKESSISPVFILSNRTDPFTG